MSQEITTRTFEQLQNPYKESLLNEVQDYWASRKFGQVLGEMPEPHTIEIDGGRTVKLVEIAPHDRNGHDTDTDIVLGLPYLNGYTPHHYIRARTLQLLNPNYSVWLMPNNGTGERAYDFTWTEKARLASGNIRPLGEIMLRALENAPHRLGTLAITGYSQGGLTALSMAAVGSDILDIEQVNADEIPSVDGRNAKQLNRDFIRSGGLGELRGAILDADIPALTEAMNMRRVLWDITKFGVKSMTTEGRLMKEAMTGSANDLVSDALDNDVNVKLGAVAGSSLLDMNSITVESPHLHKVQYEGAPFNHMHTTGDNVIAHALMADDGLSLY